GENLQTRRVRGPHHVPNATPIRCEQRFAKLKRRVADTVEQFEQFSVAVDMTFCYFPIIGARVAGLACVNNDDSFLQFGNVNFERLSTDSVLGKMNTRNTAVSGRIVILKACGNSY